MRTFTENFHAEEKANDFIPCGDCHVENVRESDCYECARPPNAGDFEENNWEHDCEHNVRAAR